MKAFLLAAGFGSRLRPLTSSIPKPLVPFLNRPLVSLQHKSLLECCEQVRFNISYLKAPLIKYFCESERTSWVEEESPIGSARTVWESRDYFDQNTIVACADVFARYDPYQLARSHELSGALITIATTTVDDPRRFGVVVTDNLGQVIKFQEKPQDPMSSTVSTGVYVFSPEVLEYWSEDWTDIGQDLFPALVAKGIPINTMDIGCHWNDIGRIKDYLMVQLRELGAASMDCSISRESTIDRCVIGDGVAIEDNVHLTNCIVWPGSTVKAGVTANLTVITPDYMVSL
jgi:NDP-sugar pyrophosphorylase family protein